MKRYTVVALAAAAVLAVDQVTKSWAVQRLGPLPGVKSIPVIGSLEWRLAYNSGMAFSQGQGRGPLIAVVALTIVGILIWFARSVEATWGRVVIGVVIGGALGNLADRAFRPPAPGGVEGFMRGAVVDFIYLRWWPTFNVADACVVVGGILLAILAFRLPDPAEGGSDPAEGGSDPAAGGPEDSADEPADAPVEEATGTAS